MSRYLIVANTGYGNAKRGIAHMPKGSVVSLPADVGARLVEVGILAALPPEKKPARVETAEVAPPENTAKRTTKPPAKAAAKVEVRADEGKKAK